MDQYIFLEKYYNEDLNSQLLNEFDLSSLTSSFKEQFSKINMHLVSNIYQKYEKNITKKLKEFDVDVDKIKKIAKKSAKSIYSDINNAYTKKIPVKTISKIIDKKILMSVEDEIINTSNSLTKIIFLLILSFVMIIFVMTVLLFLFSVILGVNIYLAYFFILLFLYEISSVTSSFVFSVFGKDKDESETVGLYKMNNKVLNNLSIDKLNNRDVKVYTVQVLTESFKNIIKKFK